MHPLPGLDLSRLYKNLVFCSDSAARSRQELSRILHSHDLTLGRGNINTSLFRHQLNHASVMMLTYGAQAEIQAGAFNDFTLMQTPLHGSAEFETEGMQMKIGRGEIAIMPPGHSITFHWQKGCEQLILKIPHAVIDKSEYGATPRSLLSSCHQNIRQPPIFKLDIRATAPWYAMVQQLINLPAAGEPACRQSTWFEDFEKSIALFLLSQTPRAANDQSEDMSHEELDTNATSTASIEPLIHMEQYIRHRLYAPISLADLANVAGLSPRSLNSLCQRHLKVSPMTFLRNSRLDAARHVLRSRPGANIAQIALDHGFEHLGRFSAYYRARFGELPRDTAAAFTAGNLLQPSQEPNAGTCSQSANNTIQAKPLTPARSTR